MHVSVYSGVLLPHWCFGFSAPPLACVYILLALVLSSSVRGHDLLSF